MAGVRWSVFFALHQRYELWPGAKDINQIINLFNGLPSGIMLILYFHSVQALVFFAEE
jgi:hypothetical protein